MSWFWSPSKAGFFNDLYNVPGCVNPVPSDAIPITDQQHQDLLDGQSGNAALQIARRIISGPGGVPELQDY